MMKNSNSVFAKYRKKSPKLNVEKLEDNCILIEGDRLTLEFLGEVIMVHARNKSKDCGIQFEPKGAGSKFFSKKSKFGLYIHLLGTGCSKDKKLK